ncbi:MAG: tRNA 2-selenouridine(34) synthase MnmH [Pseudomonadota bacterium]
MSLQLTSLSDLLTDDFDDFIDARSPAEFAEDHLPGAINLPVLDNDERARVGTMYVQTSRFRARKIGAALVLKNVAKHLETELVERDGSWRPLVYCWRGGQRSGTFGWLLSEIGWRTETLAGGYRSYRRLVVRMLYDSPLPFRLVVLDGMTCTAKTAFLHDLEKQGMQVLDLEGMADHRGSVFGATTLPQPSQKSFETRIAMHLARLSPDRPVVVEAESSKVGDLLIPPQLWAAMCSAPRVEITAPLEARARYFSAAYPDLVSDPALFARRIERLRAMHGAARIGGWLTMLEDQDFSALAADLMIRHYDTRYAKHRQRHNARVVLRMNINALHAEARQKFLPQLTNAIEKASVSRPSNVA